MASPEYSKYIKLVAEYDKLSESNKAPDRATKVNGKMTKLFKKLSDDEQEMIKDIYFYVER